MKFQLKKYIIKQTKTVDINVKISSLRVKYSLYLSASIQIAAIEVELYFKQSEEPAENEESESGSVTIPSAIIRYLNHSKNRKKNILFGVTKGL